MAVRSDVLGESSDWAPGRDSKKGVAYVNCSYHGQLELNDGLATSCQPRSA
jgi:hypothetical protein